MQRGLRQKIFAAAVLAAAVAGCAPGVVIDKLPGDMGLPAGTPERPATPYQYPAVHDMPPPRDTQPLSEADQVALEKQLREGRDRQEAAEAAAAAQDAQAAKGDTATTPAPATPNKPALVKKKKPNPANPAAATDTAGAKTSGAKTNP